MLVDLLSGCPAQLVEGGGPLNSFSRYLNASIFFPRQLSTGLKQITGGTILGDDALLFYAFSPRNALYPAVALTY